jgi:DNA-binding transcriptional LysR family regulator
MNIEFIKTFLTLASAKNISGASETLNLSQATISLQLKSLEKELGFLLFERHKGRRQLNLTQRGYDFWFIAEKMIQLYGEANSLGQKNKCRLIISSIDSIGNYTFLQFYNQIVRGRLPIKLQVFTNRSCEIYNQIENHSADVGFVQKYYNYPDMNIIPIFKEKMQIIFSNKFKKIPKAPINPEELNFEQEILIDWGDAFLRWHNAWCNPNIFPSLSVGNSTIGLRFLQEGEYWAIMPCSVIKQFQLFSPLRAYTLSVPPPDRTCYKLTHQSPNTSKILGIEMLENHLNSYLKSLQKEAFISEINCI